MTKTYMQPQTLVTDITMTVSLLAGSGAPTPDAHMDIIDGGDPLDSH